MEAEVSSCDRIDISEWNEEEMERWQLGQIAFKIEQDKPLIVISMWTFGAGGFMMMWILNGYEPNLQWGEKSNNFNVCNIHK